MKFNKPKQNIQKIVKSKSIKEKIKDRAFRKEEDFLNFLQKEIAPSLNFTISPNNLMPTQVLYESKLFKVTSSSASQVERYAKLTNLSILLYADQIKASLNSSKPVLTIPLINIK